MPEISKKCSLRTESLPLCDPPGIYSDCGPPLYPQMLDDGDPAERELGLQLGQQLLRRCDELWVCGDRISSGMAREISEANQLSIPVKNIDTHEIQKEQLPAEMEQVTASGQGLGII